MTTMESAKGEVNLHPLADPGEHYRLADVESPVPSGVDTM